jgi:hypothetical protein
LARKLGGQLRVNGSTLLGFDMTTALAMAEALGVDRRAVAELLPIIEGAMVRKISEARES